MVLNITPKALAQTYAHPSKDPWDAVRLYRIAMTYPDNWGAQRVATAINNDSENEFTGIGRSELRAWIDGDGMPDAVRAIDHAETHGWTADEWTPVTRTLAHLVIGTYVCGSISTETYVPSWSPETAVSEQLLTTALTDVGCEWTQLTRTTTQQGDECRPTTHGSQLGRALVVAGAPRGDKTATTVTGLPGWLETAPASLKRSLAQFIVRERGIQYQTKETRQIQTARSQEYFTELAGFLADVTGEPVTASTNGVTVSAAAVRQLEL